MDSDKDVLEKADALLRRHAVGTETGGVPVLTDLVDEAGDAEAIAALSREVFLRVMAEVEGRLAVDLEKRVAEQLVAQVHGAVASALGDLRQELANAIGDAVSEAIRQRRVK
ncbi:MAG: hypothetical protein ACXWG1_08075 [Usitatibacter sp.]